jgi:hypothetical protein
VLATYRSHLDAIKQRLEPNWSMPLVERLGRINLVNCPMTRAEGEWAYLARNIEAQDLGAHPVVSKALAVAGGVDEAALDSVFAAHANEAIGMDDAQLSDFAQRLALEAEAASLPTKVKIVRDAVAKATGYGDGAALASSPGYDPAPRRSGGWLIWERFDITSDPAQLKKACGTVPLHHAPGGAALVWDDRPSCCDARTGTPTAVTTSGA